MLSVLLGVLALTGAAQAEERIVKCVSEMGRAELVFEKRGGFHFPLPPKFVSARLGGKPLELPEIAQIGEGGREYYFQKGPYRFYVFLDGRFEVEIKLFGDPQLIDEGQCDGRP